MKRQFLSIILSVTLLASAIAGAISVSIKSAAADTSSEVLYYGDFKNKWLSISNNNRYMVSIFETVDSLWDDPSFNFFVFEDDLGNTVFISFQYTTGDGFYGYGWNGMSSLKAYPSGNSYFKLLGFFQYNIDHFRHIDTYNSSLTWANRNFALNLSNDDTPSWYFLSNYEINAGLHLYSLRNLVATGNTGWDFSANVYAGYEPPLIIDFELVKFKLGERSYLTTRDQNLVFNMKPYDDDYLWWYVGFMQEDGSDATGYVLDYTDMTLIPGAENWLNVGLINIHSDGVLAYDITDLLSWHDIWSSTFYWISEDPMTEDPSQYTPYAEASNVPFLLTEGDNSQPDSYTNAWNEFNQYVNNYNQTHIIPEQLGDWLFETNGSKLFPCSVQVPTHIWYNKFQTTSAPDNHIWRWGGSLIQEEGFQYSLFDTVIVGESDSGYGIRYFYDDTLTPSYNYIDEMLFANLIDSFDVVIIVPESEGILYDIPGVNVGPVGYTGSSSAGVVYTNDPLVGNTLQGFCILTERAIAKQKLWNFNEGITKLYDLEVKYIDSEDKWKDSFLLWSASMFDMLNSLDGRLTDINTNLLSISSLIESIKYAVDHMAYDDDPENLQPWYLSLWNWITNFRPSDSDFSATLNQYDNNWEDFPELPAPSTVPLLPGGE